MNFNFNAHGYLYPYDAIEATLEDFRMQFVDGFQKDSSRYELFVNYLDYMHELSTILTHDYYQWIDGSFVTKKISPNDIDIVTLIDFEDYERNIDHIKQRLVSKYARSIFEVDAYIVPVYPENHEKGVCTELDLLYWRNLFGKTKASRRQKKRKKGFIQLNYSRHE